jgi:hypothetical protein
MSSANEKFEREFEAFLNEEDSRLSTLYRKLPQTEPDARLDAAVRSMAHRALNPQLVATPRPESGWRPVRWIPALGTAAGLVLAAGIAWRMGPSLNQRNETGAPSSDVISVRPLDAPAPATAPLSPPPPPAAEMPPRRAAPQAKAVSATPSSGPAEQEKALPRAKADETPQHAESQRAEVGALGKVEDSAKPAAQPQAFPPPAKAQTRAPEMDAVERKQIMAKGAWQNLHDRESHEAGPVGGKDAAIGDKAPAVAGAAALETQAASKPQAQSTVAAPSRATQAEMTPAPAAAPALPPEAVTAAPPAARAVQSAAPIREESASRGDAGQSAPAQRPRSSDPNARLYPEHWLANIQTMLKENRRDEALRSLAEFRRMYPDYHLPDDLRDLK